MSQTTNLGKVRITPKGAHIQTQTYEFLDVVTSGGSSYLAIQDVPANIVITNTTYWQLIASKGGTGEITGATASISGGYGTPAVSVTEGGTATERTFAFAFSNLVGNGIVSITGEKTGTSGNTDTYTMTITYDSGDTDTVTYEVTNGSVTSVDGMTGDVDLSNKYATITDLEQGTIVPDLANNANNLTPYSKDSGAIQDAAFISQGTGTNNNTEIVTTGDQAKQLEKLGNAVVANQMCKSKTNSTLSVAGVTFTNNNDGTWTANGTATALDGVVLNDAFNTVQGHRYLFGVICSDANIQGYEYISNTIYSRKNGLSVLTGTGNNFQPRVTVENGATYTNAKLRFVSIDLDKWTFTADQIADLTANPSHFSWYYNGSLTYNAGSIEHGNGVKLVCTRGRNLLNPNAVVKGKKINTDGSISVTAEACYVMISVIPNTTIYIRDNHSTRISVMPVFYDINGNFLGRLGNSENLYKIITIPANCHTIGLTCYTDNSYLDEHYTVSPYYTPEQGGEGYENDYPYEAPDIIDTGSETLLAFDKKTPDGVITRKTTSRTFDGTENWQAYTDTGRVNQFYLADVADVDFTSSTIVGTISNKFIGIAIADRANNYGTCYIGQNAICFNVNPSVVAEGDVNAWKTWLANNNVTCEYLSVETTEQGSSFRQYADINDYGIMYWLNLNDELISIPQGLKIQYPVNYKGALDDLVMYTNGDVTSLAKKENIEDSALQARGYYKMQDLSSGITSLVTGLTIQGKKAYKQGNLVCLYLDLQNSSGATIAANTDLFSLSSDLVPLNRSGWKSYFVCISGNSEGELTIANGNGSCSLPVYNDSHFICNIVYMAN